MLDLKMKHLGNVGRAVFFGAAIGLVTMAGCKKADGTQTADNTGPDPADVNQAPVAGSQAQYAPAPQAGQPAKTTRVLAQSQTYQGQQQTESYPQAAPIERSPDPQNYRPPYTQDQNSASYQQGDENFDQTIDQYAEQAPEPPPPLPVYEQPPCPEPNYLWTPGYWSYAPAGYFWVPGAWAAPPYYGALWTPGYWGAYGGRYGFHRGFWGLHIGFYGGISYGFGYTGSGYHGGYWNGNNFYYNRAVNRVNETIIHNTYVRNVTINNTVINNRISYSGGRGGVQARPAAYEVAAMHEQHTPPMAAQVQLREQSQQNRQQFFSANQGRPAAVVAPRPLVADRGIAAPPRLTFQPSARPEQPSNGRPAQGVAGAERQRGIQPAQPQRSEVQQQQRSQQESQQGSEQLQQQQQREQQQRSSQELQQRNQQLQQQHSDQQLQQQRNDAQRNQQQQLQQQRTEQQQRNQQQQLQQQRNDAQRSQQLQQQQQQREEQERNQQRMQPHPQPNEQRPQPQAAQPRSEPQRPAAQPQPHPEAARPAPQPHGDGERRPPH